MNSFRAGLAGGAAQLGFCVMYPSPGVIERIGADWDWIWVDGQHGQFGYNDILNTVRACDLIGKPALVRVPGHDFGTIGLALDAGASGIIVPCVDTPEQARLVVDAAKFPPLGRRSFGGRRPIDRLGRGYADTANDDVLLIAQIETPEAIENVETIAAMPGVNALFLGPDDIMLRRGCSMTQPGSAAALHNDMKAVSDACRKHGKHAVMVGMTEEILKVCLEMGFDLIVAGDDVPFLVNGSHQASQAARATIANCGSTGT